MRQKDFPDIQEILDSIFSAAEEIKQAVADEIGLSGFKKTGAEWFEYRDYYPGYTYPPMNVYVKADKSMVFQISLAGFAEKDIKLEFRGDYLLFSANYPEETEAETEVRYLKHRLKLKSIPEQRYYVPADKFNQEAVQALLKNSILSITIPPKEDPKESAGVSINITTEK